MKVYIVISYVDYECCHNVEGVFDTLEKAKNFAQSKEAREFFSLDNFDIWTEEVK